MNQRDPELERIADEQIAIIAKGQEPDGYLYAARTVGSAASGTRCRGGTRWSREGGSHELYNMGHAIEAAIAYSHWATGKQGVSRCGDQMRGHALPDVRTGPPARHLRP